jgi:hypothetical protein
MSISPKAAPGQEPTGAADTTAPWSIALLPDQLEDIRDAEVLEIAPERCSHR